MASRQFEPDPDEEQALWDQAVDNVKPLAKDHRVRPKTAPRVARPLAPEPYRRPPSRSRDTEPDETEGDSGWVADGIDRRQLRKLRRGQWLPGRRLDLHGMTRTAAISATRRFIETNRIAFRCIAVVHGRGLHSNGRPVIKGEVRALLREHPAVLAYSDAPRDDGGSGAVYVLLRG